MLITLDYLLPYKVVKEMSESELGLTIDGEYYIILLYDIDFIGDEGCRVTFKGVKHGTKQEIEG